MKSEESRRRNLIPLYLGVFLGIISVVIGKIPKEIAIWTGMTVIGNHVGYLLGALAAAYFNPRGWLRSFISSYLTILIATAVYYFLIFITQLFSQNNAEYGFESGLITWPVIGFFCAVLSAAAVWILKNVKSKLIRAAVYLTGYLGMLTVIYFFIARFIINLHRINPEAVSRQPGGFPGMVFEIVFAVAVTTAVWVYAIFSKQLRPPQI